VIARSTKCRWREQPVAPAGNTTQLARAAARFSYSKHMIKSAMTCASRDLGRPVGLSSVKEVPSGQAAVPSRVLTTV
jgi:hypothetical protein